MGSVVLRDRSGGICAGLVVFQTEIPPSVSLPVDSSWPAEVRQTMHPDPASPLLDQQMTVYREKTEEMVRKWNHKKTMGSLVKNNGKKPISEGWRERFTMEYCDPSQQDRDRVKQRLEMLEITMGSIEREEGMSDSYLSKLLRTQPVPSRKIQRTIWRKLIEIAGLEGDMKV